MDERIEKNKIIIIFAIVVIALIGLLVYVISNTDYNNGEENIKIIVLGPRNTTIDYSEYTEVTNLTSAYNMPGHMDYLGYNHLFEYGFGDSRQFFEIYNGSFEWILKPTSKFFRINIMAFSEDAPVFVTLLIYKGNKTIVNETQTANPGSYATFDRYYDKNLTLMQSFNAGSRE